MTLDVENVTRILDCAERLFRHYGYARPPSPTSPATSACRRPTSIVSSPPRSKSTRRLRPDARRELQMAYEISICRSAPRSGSAYVHAQYKMTLEDMLDEQKVHEMVIVAIERDWHVIEKHVDSIHDLLMPK
jgi:hypothetical protein